MKSFHIPRTALFFILFALAAFAVRGMWKLFIRLRLLWRLHLRQMPLGDEEAHSTGGKYHIIAGDAVEHQHAHHLAPFQKAAEHQQKGRFN